MPVEQAPRQTARQDGIVSEKHAIVDLLRTGRAAEAEDRAAAWTRGHPDDVFGWSVLGSLRLNRGEAGLAESCLAKAAALAPQVADLAVNLGLARAELGDGAGALACYDRALTLDAACVPARTNRGAALQAAGRLEEAVADYDAALLLDPEHATAQYNRANALAEQGRLAEALAGYDRAIALRPHYALALAARGLLLAAIGRPREAEGAAREALAATPDQPQALELLARCLLAHGADPETILPVIERALAGCGGLEAKRLFIACLERLPPERVDDALRDRLATALAEPWARPETLIPVAARLLAHDPAFAPGLERAQAVWPEDLAAPLLFGPAGPAACGRNALLVQTLTAGPVCAPALERFCTLARRCLLDAATEAAAPWNADPDALVFFAALAEQCRINEYAFAVTPDEADRAQALTAALGRTLRDQAPLAPLAVLATAAYAPLAALPEAAVLDARDGAAPVAALVRRQLAEEAEERRARETMPALTPIEDEVSRRVRRQYEENPYPRWIRAAPVDAPTGFDGFLARRFPLADYQPLGRTDRLDILVAGCGSGQHALETARRYRGAQVLAVDLSLASLAYAQRKAREAGVDNLAFAQADLLRLGALDRRFDLIEATGVLHHLRDPWAGWRALLGLLRPGGCMRLGFYSELARRNMPRLRVMLQVKGYTTEPDSLRRCRQELLALPPDDPTRRLLMQDFYSLSGCRDLLFHVCEHALTLPAIAAFLTENDLRFLGFDIEPETLAAYARRFPDDPAATDLEHWHAFELDHQDTFLEMYQFWVQRPPA